MTLTLILVIVLAHFVGDFLCQSDWMALNKSKRWDAMAQHVIVYVAVLALPVLLWLGDYGTSSETNARIWTWVIVNGYAHFAQDAITSRITARLWFFRVREGVWCHLSVPSIRGTDIEKERLYNPYTYDVGDRHWFFVMIGADQALHFVTLFVTASWWLQ